jgi:hypothetical protein
METRDHLRDLREDRKMILKSWKFQEVLRKFIVMVCNIFICSEQDDMVGSCAIKG